uniref:Uncharacterized protein n=1 Tax=Trichuris muris TaxID=70415 RepID=A0A5S6R0V7_TRIMR
MSELLTLEQYVKKHPHLKPYCKASLERLYEEEQLDYVVALHGAQYINEEKTEEKIMFLGSTVSGILLFFIATGAVAHILIESLIQTLRSRHGTHGQARDVIWRCTVEKAEPTPVQTAAMFSKCLFRRSRGGGRSVKGSVQTISQAYLAALNVVKPLIAGPPYETMQKFTLTDVCMDGTFVNEDLSGKIAWCTVLSFT